MTFTRHVCAVVLIIGMIRIDICACKARNSQSIFMWEVFFHHHFRRRKCASTRTKVWNETLIQRTEIILCNCWHLNWKSDLLLSRSLCPVNILDVCVWCVCKPGGHEAAADHLSEGSMSWLSQQSTRGWFWLTAGVTIAFHHPHCWWSSFLCVCLCVRLHASSVILQSHTPRNPKK